MSLTASNVFVSLSDQKLGFSYAKPKRVDEKSLTVVLPIIRETSIKRQYITFPETDKCLVFDTGKIDQMEVDNKSEDHVFIRSGTLFRGSTQERALQRSAVVIAGQKMGLEVRCVHATRGIRGKAETKWGGLTPLNLDQNNYDKHYTPKDQQTTWSNVHNSNAAYCSLSGQMHGSLKASASFHDSATRDFHETYWSSSASGQSVSGNWASSSGMDDLASHMDLFAAQFDEVLSKIKREENQAGLALITDGGVQTIEIFDHADSWKALHEAAVKRMGAELVKEDKESVFEFKPNHAHKMVNRVLAMDWNRKNIFTRRPNNGEPLIEITGLTAVGFVGEIVEMNEQVVHLTILKCAN